MHGLHTYAPSCKVCQLRVLLRNARYVVQHLGLFFEVHCGAFTADSMCHQTTIIAGCRLHSKLPARFYITTVAPIAREPVDRLLVSKARRQHG